MQPYIMTVSKILGLVASRLFFFLSSGYSL